MTKFEEEVKPIATVEMKVTSDGNEINFHCKTGLSDYLLSKGNADLYLKSQLQQQALPVVPECVAGAIESLPEHYSAFEAISLINAKVNALPEENEDWLPVYNWLCEGIGNQNIFALAFITGKYEVEKPQLFRLKLKNTPISNYYLWLNQATGKVFVDKKFLDWTNHDNVKNIFTEQEIAKISDGAFVNNEAFELVPVEDGE